MIWNIDFLILYNPTSEVQVSDLFQEIYEELREEST